MDVRRPLWLQRFQAPGARSLAVLYALESFARATVVSLIPIEALRLMEHARGVSLLFLAVSFAGLGATLTVPWLVRKLARRWVYTLGALLLAGATVSMMAGTLPFLALGLVLRVGAVVMMTVCLSLYILDHVSRTEYTRAEPMRLMFAGVAWMIGPTLGAWLAETAGLWATYALSSVSALVCLAYFWHLRLRDTHTLTVFKGQSPNPLRHVARYAQQPRLIFAWVAAIGRYIWWVMFFIYVPIYVVESGYSKVVAGALISAGTGFLLFLPLFGRLVRRFGIRAVLRVGFTVSGVLTIGAALLAGSPLIAIAVLLVSTLAMISLDAVANLPFMLLVRRGERTEMTTVYSTYRDFGEICAPALFTVLLTFAALPAVFAATGVLMLGLSLLSRTVHPRLGRSASHGQAPDPTPASAPQ